MLILGRLRQISINGSEEMADRLIKTCSWLFFWKKELNKHML